MTPPSLESAREILADAASRARESRDPFAELAAAAIHVVLDALASRFATRTEFSPSTEYTPREMRLIAERDAALKRAEFAEGNVDHLEAKVMRQASAIECKHPVFAADVTEHAWEDGVGVVVDAAVRCATCGVHYYNARDARADGVFPQADAARRAALDAWRVGSVRAIR